MVVLSVVLALAKFNVCPYLFSGFDRAGILCVPYRADSRSLGLSQLLPVRGWLMTLYSLYLGWRKSYEERLVTIPENIQRCPFVMGMLQQSKITRIGSSFASDMATW